MIYYLDSHQRSKLEKLVTKHKPELYPFPRIIDYINYVNKHIVPKQLKYSESYCWGQPKEYVIRSWHNDPRSYKTVVNTENRFGDHRRHRTSFSKF